MRSTVPYDPRVSRTPDQRFVGRLGREAIERYRRGRALLGTLGSAVLAVRTPGVAAGRVIRRVLLMQIFYTGFEAVPLIGTVSVLLGATIVIQTELMVPAADSALIGKVMIAVVLRELAPLITAIVVAGRSGTAIATELGNMKVSSEILALTSLGIDPPRFIVLPRLIAAVVSVLVLMVYFAATALAGTALMGVMIANIGFGAFQTALSGALTIYDLGLFLVKGVGLGAIVGWLCCHYGLEVKSSPTEVPQMASRAVVRSLLGCVAYNTLATALFYWTVGHSLR